MKEALSLILALNHCDVYLCTTVVPVQLFTDNNLLLLLPLLLMQAYLYLYDAPIRVTFKINQSTEAQPPVASALSHDLFPPTLTLVHINTSAIISQYPSMLDHEW